MKKIEVILVLVILGLASGCGQSSSPKFEQVRSWERGTVRVFAIYTPDLDWEAMKAYAVKKKWSKGDSTTVYFFNNRVNTPAVTYLQPGAELLERHKQYWVAWYRRQQDGSEKFLKYPARQRKEVPLPKVRGTQS